MFNISLRQLAAIASLARTRRINETAGQLGLTAPAVTLQLRQVEAQIGARLFDRTRAGLVPTEVGLAVIASAEDVQERLEALKDEVNALISGSGGRVRLGAVSTAKYFAPAMIAVVAPHEGLSLRFFMTDASRGEALGSARADFAFHVSGPLEAGSASRVLFVDPFVTVWDPRHGAAPASLDRFCARAHVLATPEGGEFGAIDAKLRDVGRARRIAARTQNVFSAVRLVAGSPLVAVAPRSVAEEIARAHGLEIGRPPIALPPASISLVWSKSTEADPACAWFREGVFARFGASAARGGPGRKSAKS